MTAPDRKLPKGHRLAHRSVVVEAELQPASDPQAPADEADPPERLVRADAEDTAPEQDNGEAQVTPTRATAPGQMRRGSSAETVSPKDCGSVSHTEVTRSAEPAVPLTPYMQAYCAVDRVLKRRCIPSTLLLVDEILEAVGIAPKPEGADVPRCMKHYEEEDDA